MLFEYPYKLYRLGYYIFMTACAYATFLTFSTPLSYKFRVAFLLIILLLTRGIKRYYMNNYYRFKPYVLTLYPKKLDILFDYQTYTFTHNQIRSIYYAEQIERLKLYHVIHIFTVNYQHFYFSNELVRFYLQVKLLEKYYYDKFRRIDHLLKEFSDKDESSYYLEYLQNKKR